MFVNDCDYKSGAATMDHGEKKNLMLINSLGMLLLYYHDRRMKEIRKDARSHNTNMIHETIERNLNLS